jgi:hypothetical protein
MGCIPAHRLGVQPLRLMRAKFGTWRYPYCLPPDRPDDTMKTQTLTAHTVRAGMNVVLAGSVYEVESNLFDRHGKGSNQALSVLVCNSKHVVQGYGQGEHFGLLPSTPVHVIVASPELV